MLAAKGGMMLTQDVAYALYNKLKDFSEWSQCSIMAILLRFTPDDSEEVFDILVCRKLLNRINFR